MIAKTCCVCKRKLDPAQPDPCLGMLPGVKAACCGHGEAGMGYIMFENGIAIYFDPDCVIDWNSHDDTMNEPGSNSVRRSKLERVEFKTQTQ